MKTKLVLLLCSLVASLLLLPTQPASAYPAAYFRTRQLRIPPALCQSEAQDAVKQAGLANISNGSTYSGGTTNTARAFIVCVSLPKAGPCPNNVSAKDGATAVMVAAGDNSDETKNLISVLDTKLGNPVLIDCN
ncbi:MAG TPA: hypothetical protein DCY88_05255 [Cyanobacteria bacterium UBA11372]|nr:hypothetical protein [Cyanobacteria bacterium UBA11372]